MAGAAARTAGRPTCCSSCWTIPASASWAATARRSRRRTSTRWPQEGLLFNNMHTTALCSPSALLHPDRAQPSLERACRASPKVRPAIRAANGHIPFENGFLSEMLLQHGYNTSALGKWHLTPADQISAAGPYDRWPLGRGFERYYGFLGGDTHQYYPDLVFDNHQVEPPRTPEQGYHLTEDLVDKAIGFIADSKQVAPEKPFFMYFCPGAMHAPHQVPKEWADKYKGKFDDGWDAYREQGVRQSEGAGHHSARMPNCRATIPTCSDWNTLSRRREEAVRPDDGGVRRVPRRTPTIITAACSTSWSDRPVENTLIMFISDNGASAEGGPHGSVNENKFFNNVPETLEENLKRSTNWAGRRTSITTPGVGPSRAIRRSAAGSARPTAAASATRSSSTGRRASRRKARCARSMPTPSTWCRRCSRRWASRPPTAIEA